MANLRITELTGYTPPIDTDVIPIVDITTPATKKITWANIKTALSLIYANLTNPQFTASVGIGVAANSAYALNIIKNSTDLGTQYGININSVFTETVNSSNIQLCARFDYTMNISAGVNDAGHSSALETEALRDYGVSDAGRKGQILGVTTAYGHYLTHADAVTDEAMGVQITPYCKTGTISAMYSLYIGDYVGGGTATNYWDIYQKNATAKNYFAGNIGIGIASPTQKLEVAGNIKANTNNFVVEGGTARNIIRSIATMIEPGDTPNTNLNITQQGASMGAFNAPAITDASNLAKNATSGSWSLSADGTAITMNLTEDIKGVIAVSIFYPKWNTAETKSYYIRPYITGNNVVFYLHVYGSWVDLDWTTILDANDHVAFLFSFITST